MNQKILIQVGTFHFWKLKGFLMFLPPSIACCVLSWKCHSSQANPQCCWPPQWTCTDHRSCSHWIFRYTLFICFILLILNLVSVQSHCWCYTSTSSGVRAFVTKPVATNLQYVGGAAAILGLVAMASDVEGLYAAVKALVCVVKSNPLASKEMERIKGYQVGHDFNWGHSVKKYYSNV